LVAIACAVAANLDGAREWWPWFVTYVNNYYPPQGTVPYLAHFWSLAVEEQFYTVCPAMLLFTPNRQIGKCFVAMIVGAAIVRTFAAPGAGAYLWSIARMDALAIGGWIAWRTRQVALPQWRGLLGIGLAGVAVGTTFPASARVFTETGMVFLSACILVITIRFANVPRWLSPVVWIGGISYGLYVWHYLLPGFAFAFGPKVYALSGIPLVHGWPYFRWTLAAALVVATTSWYLFERPANNFKRFFPYVLPELNPAIAGSPNATRSP
jgi:peptidoglycan/LPS O-acetylase OafA/YrhL